MGGKIPGIAVSHGHVGGDALEEARIDLSYWVSGIVKLAERVFGCAVVSTVDRDLRFLDLLDQTPGS